jgi:glutamate dehydrogenase (NAD(P)+)
VQMRLWTVVIIRLAHAVVAFEAVAPKDLLTWKCEILISASAENVITRRNADRIQARIIAEGANGPTTAVADEILADTQLSVIPDILANAGGVTAS